MWRHDSSSHKIFPHQPSTSEEGSPPPGHTFHTVKWHSPVSRVSLCLYWAEANLKGLAGALCCLDLQASCPHSTATCTGTSVKQHEAIVSMSTSIIPGAIIIYGNHWAHTNQQVFGGCKAPNMPLVYTSCLRVITTNVQENTVASVLQTHPLSWVCPTFGILELEEASETSLDALGHSLQGWQLWPQSANQRSNIPNQAVGSIEAQINCGLQFYKD